MSRMREVIKKHMANPEQVLSCIDDLLDLFVFKAVIGEFTAVYESEKEGLKKTRSTLDQKSEQAAMSDLEKLKAMIDELEEVSEIDPDGLKRAIGARYMK